MTGTAAILRADADEGALDAKIHYSAVGDADDGRRHDAAEARLKQNPDTGIASCTRLLGVAGKRLTPNLKAIIYVARGNSYVIKKSLDAAFPDFDQAITLDPKY